MHGGTIEARSEGRGKGSEFVVRLRLAPDAIAPPPEPKREVARAGHPRRVLVVDDNRDAADALALLLRMRGATVRVAESGPIALDALPACRPELVLLDLGMPEMDGFEVARRMRATPEGRDAVLVALTGWGQEQDRARTRAAGFDHHLVKPAELGAIEALFATIGARGAKATAGGKEGS
jgi:CheY-like chemotaxis protein